MYMYLFVSVQVLNVCVKICNWHKVKKKVLLIFLQWFVYYRKILIISGWLLLALLAYKVSQFDYEYANFDPYEILGVPVVSATSKVKCECKISIFCVQCNDL